MYNILVVPMITYRCETWALKNSDVRKIVGEGMKLRIRMVGVILRDMIRSATITSEFRVMLVMKKIKCYGKNRRKHVEQIEETRSLKQVLQETEEKTH